jgi:hypothetical protein
VRFGPSAGARERDRYPWFSFFFVYAEVDGYVLIGAGPFFTGQDKRYAPDAVVQGWIAATDLARWNTREAYHWDRPSTLPTNGPARRERPGRIFKSPGDAYQALGGIALDRDGSLFSEKFDREGISPQILAQEPRFPKLRWHGDRDYPVVHPLTNNRLIKVGWIGGFEGQGLKLSSQEIARMQSALERMQSELDRTEILFVVDDSLSMLSWNRFEKVAELVNQINEDVRLGAGGNVHLAVAYYNDKKPFDGNHKPVTTSRLKDIEAHGKTIIGELRRHEPASGIQSDPREMVFHGIATAIAAAGFSDSARKLVIVLGDMGDKTDADDRAAQKEIVRRLMPESPFPIEFYAMQLMPQDIRHSEAILFEEQMRAIAGGLRTAVLRKNERRGADAINTERKTEVSGFFRSDDPDQVTQMILARYEELKRQRLDLQTRITRLMRGDWHTTIQPELQEWLEREGFPVAELRRTRGYQQFMEGWVWEYAPHTNGQKRSRQIRLWALLNRSEIEDLVDMLTRLTAETRGVRGVSLKELLIQEVQRLTGDVKEETIQNTSLADAMKKATGLDARTPLLNAQVGQIDARFTREDLYRLVDRRNRLQDILDGKRSTWKRRYTTDPNTGDRLVLYDRVGRSELHDRRYTIPGSNSTWYWVDVAEELP